MVTSPKNSCSGVRRRTGTGKSVFGRAPPFPVFTPFRHEISCFHVRWRMGTCKSVFVRSPAGFMFFLFSRVFATKSAVFAWSRPKNCMFTSAGGREPPSPFSSGHHRERVFPVFSCFRHEISCFHVVSPKKLHVHHRRPPGTAKSFFGRAPPGNTFFPFPRRFASKSAVFTWFRHRTGCPGFVDARSLYIDLGTLAQSKVEPHPL